MVLNLIALQLALEREDALGCAFIVLYNAWPFTAMCFVLNSLGIVARTTQTLQVAAHKETGILIG